VWPVIDEGALRRPVGGRTVIFDFSILANVYKEDPSLA
jgi:hypothetical protein